MRDGLRCLAAVGNSLYHWGLKSVARSILPTPTIPVPYFFQRNQAESAHQKLRGQHGKCRTDPDVYCPDSLSASGLPEILQPDRAVSAALLPTYPAQPTRHALLGGTPNSPTTKT